MMLLLGEGDVEGKSLPRNTAERLKRHRIKRKPIKRSRMQKKATKRPRAIKRIKPLALKKNLEALQKKLVIKLYGNDCFTCPQKNLIGVNCQLGHVPWPRSILSTECKFAHNYTRIQCYNCNINRGGMGAVALARMIKEGVDVEAKWQLNEDTKGKTYSRLWFELRIQAYEEQLKEYEKNR